MARSAANILVFLLGLLCVAVLALVLVGIYFFQMLRRQPQPRNNSQPLSLGNKLNGLTSRGSQELEHEILSMLHGDQKTLKRLLANSQQRNRGQSREWHLEKVKYDLERDRGAI